MLVIWILLSSGGVIVAVGWSGMQLLEAVRVVHVASLWAPFAAIVLLPLTVSSVAILTWALTQSSIGGSQHWLDIFASILTLFLLIAYLVCIFIVCRMVNAMLVAVPWSPLGKHALQSHSTKTSGWKLYFREARWVVSDAKRSAAGIRFKRHFHLLFEDSTLWWYTLLDFAFGVTIGISDGLGKGFGTVESCRASVVIALIVLVIQLVALCWYRPWNSSVTQCSALIATIASLIVSIIQVHNSFNETGIENEVLHRWVLILLLVGSAPTLCKYVLDILALFTALQTIMKSKNSSSKVVSSEGNAMNGNASSSVDTHSVKADDEVIELLPKVDIAEHASPVQTSSTSNEAADTVRVPSNGEQDEAWPTYCLPLVVGDGSDSLLLLDSFFTNDGAIENFIALQSDDSVC